MKTEPETKDFYRLVVKNLTREVFSRLVDHKNKMRALDKEERLFLSYLLTNYTDSITITNLKKKIETIQMPRPLLVAKYMYNYIRSLLNYGATVAANIISDPIRGHFGLPDTTNVKEFFPEIAAGLDDDFIGSDESYSLIERTIDIINKLGYKNIVVALDKLDEDTRFENDAEVIADFIKPVVTDSKLLLNQRIQLIVSIWAVPFNNLQDSVRTHKHYCPVIHWEKEDLVKALNRRLSVFSKGKLNNYLNLFDASLNNDFLSEIFILANENPRDLWHVFNSIFKAQYALGSEVTKLGGQAIETGLREFVLGFKFYEYYPKKMNSRANTMDIYSYIAHLLKLDGDTFTKNKLNERSGIGGSIHNYVIGMERMGLIKKHGQQSGSVIYRIVDPKVVYAIRNQLDIAKD